jgi:type II secretory pathway pseudopilin PulG
LLIVVAIIGILAAIAIPGYIGMQERGRKGAIERTAVSAEPEITAWIISAKKGDNKVEVDTNWDGTIGAGDKDNATLAGDGVDVDFVAARATEKSPWGGALWTTTNNQNGTIYLHQTGSSANITNVAMSVYDGGGVLLYHKILSAD